MAFSLKKLGSSLFKAGGEVPMGGDIAYGRSSMNLYGRGWLPLLPSTRIDYQVEAGDPVQNGIVMACVLWIARTFPEAPLRHMRRTKTRPEVVPDSGLTALLRRPNPYYNGLLLQQATLISWNIAGNAYWIKQRTSRGILKELWWEPHYSCRPVWNSDSNEFITGYQVLRKGHWVGPDGDTQTAFPREDVIHFRNGLDPNNPRMGLSPLGSALREIFTDNEAANFSASLLRNMGIPGIVISPAGNGPEGYMIDDPEGLKNAMVSKFGGDRRGEPLVMQGPIKTEVLSFSPEQLNLEALRNIPEERIPALLGLPSAVAGLGAGLDKNTYNNLKELKASAYESNIIPTQRLIADQLDADLIPEFADDRTDYVEFDLSKVRALAEDQDAVMKRAVMGYRGGLLKRFEGRAMINPDYESDDTEDDVYFTDLAIGQERMNVNLDEPTDRLTGDEKPKDSNAA